MPRSLDEIIEHADRLAATFEAYEPEARDEGKASPQVALRLAAIRRSQAELELRDAVRTAHASGMSWRAIGETVGTTGEAARLRYADR